jgi:phosphomannomutase
MAEEKRNEKVIALFDVDGTLTVARKEVKPEMIEFLKQLRKKVVIGTVGGSDLPKQKEQLGDNVTDMFDFVFAENGLTALRGEDYVHRTSYLVHMYIVPCTLYLVPRSSLLART